MKMTSTEPEQAVESAAFLYLAPIQGVTEVVFRNLFCRHFPGFDAAMAPFINPQGQANFTQKVLADVLPERNTGLPLIPQLLHNNAENFIAMAARLEDLGYKDLPTNNLHILHLIFGPSLAAAQAQNPRRSAATPAVLRWSPQPNLTQI
jgi:hypothetical protein